MNRSSAARRLSVGAEPQPGGGAHFRVWAPRRKRVAIVIEGEPARQIPLEAEDNGFFSAWIEAGRTGSRYRLRLDDDSTPYPDPASRFQPEGPHGPSEVIDPAAFEWNDSTWHGSGLKGQVIYELHVGTFTREGTWAAAATELDNLRDLGISLIEVLPIAEFPGRFGWGYDGVDLFAPTRLYGRPDEFRRFVNQAHALGIGVILDVVYNHFGPDGNYLTQFSHDYLTDRRATDWGEAVNFDGHNSGPVREFVLDNAAYWIDEFHLDGLRLDATQNIYDDSPEHLIAAIADRVRRAARGRATVVVGENEPQHARLIRPVSVGGFGLDALWNDDFHHTAMVAMTGRREAYYTDYLGSPQEFISAAKWGFLYQGQRYSWQEAPRGAPSLDIAPQRFITFIQNHDQVANSAQGLRCHELTSPGRFRALTALLLLGPGTPMLFQGQEFAASSPFLFFADHRPEIAKMVRDGRAKFLSQFPSLAVPGTSDLLTDPAADETFERSKLDPEERHRNAAILAMHRDLIRLRREDPAFAAQAPGGVDGAVIGPSTFVLRYFGELDPSGASRLPPSASRLLIVNLSQELRPDPVPEPLLAPPQGCRWKVLWSSDDPAYGGDGTPDLDMDEGWRIPSESAVVLKPDSVGG